MISRSLHAANVVILHISHEKCCFDTLIRSSKCGKDTFLIRNDVAEQLMQRSNWCSEATNACGECFANVLRTRANCLARVFNEGNLVARVFDEG